jgi:hypothetical protein
MLGLVAAVAAVTVAGAGAGAVATCAQAVFSATSATSTERSMHGMNLFMSLSPADGMILCR